MNHITIVGLGFEGIQGLTLEAYEKLMQPEDAKIVLKTSKYKITQFLNEKGISFDSMDQLFEEANTFDELNQLMEEYVVQCAQKQSVILGVSGSPSCGDVLAQTLLKKYPEHVNAINGQGIADYIAQKAGITFDEGFSLQYAHSLNCESINTRCWFCLAEVDHPLLASELKLLLMNYYPDDHEVYYVYNNFDLKIEKIQLCDMDRQKLYDFSVNFLIKPLDNFQKKLYDIAVLNDVVRILRGQMPLGQVTIPFNHAGCSWDKQQTHVSIRENMLEEAYEVVEAIDSDDQDNLIEELGDVLLQVMLHSQIAEETGEFTLKEVVQGICEKLIRRHPHVFGSENAQTAGQALASWDNIKKIEKKNASISDSIDGLPKVMPALEKAYKIWGKIQKTKYVDDCSYEGGWPLQNSEDIGIALLKIVEESKKLGMNPELALLEQVQQLTQRFRNWEAKK